MKKPKRYSQASGIARMIRYAFLILSLGAISLFSMSCDYIQRFYLVVDEGSHLPCFGVSHFSFKVESMSEEMDSPIVEDKYMEDFQPSAFFWSSETGKCNFGEGFPIKKIPYGGQRQLTITGYDSTGKQISAGQSPLFLVEPSGSEVQDEIIMNLSRVPNLPLGVLVIRFTVPTTEKMAKYRIIFKPYKKGSYNLNLEVREFGPKMTGGKNFLIISGLPYADQRQCTLEVTTISGQKFKSKDNECFYTFKKEDAEQAVRKTDLSKATILNKLRKLINLPLVAS